MQKDEARLNLHHIENLLKINYKFKCKSKNCQFLEKNVRKPARQQYVDMTYQKHKPKTNG